MAAIVASDIGSQIRSIWKAPLSSRISAQRTREIFNPTAFAFSTAIGLRNSKSI
jgi:hypothetical protein